MTTRALSIDAIVQDPKVRGGRPAVVLVVSGAQLGCLLDNYW